MPNKGLLQEKFEIRPEPRPRRDHNWTSFESQRRTVAIPEGRIDTSEAKKRTVLGGIDAAIEYPRSNQMPPGMDINRQAETPNKRMPYTRAGETDVSKMTTDSGMRNGFTRIPMSPTDDMYNDEHIDLFYDSVTGEDDAGNKYEGFVERHNMLDRE